MSHGRSIPFSAIVGQDSMRLALILNAIDPLIGGVLIRGERGTAKSTAVRALARLLPDHEVVDGCRFGCDPRRSDRWCAECRSRLGDKDAANIVVQQVRVVELPINATEDRVVGSIDLEAAITAATRDFAPGVLATANRNILYVDEVNLLDDHLVDVLLDVAVTGVNTVEREGVSFAHPASFMLIGTMNPDEGELRPQLLDRFGLCVDVAGLRSVEERVMVMEHVASDDAVEQAPNGEASGADARLREHIVLARSMAPGIVIPPEMRRLVALICVRAGVVGHRADIVTCRAARALCAWRAAAVAGRHGDPNDPEEATLVVTADDVVRASELALTHRRRESAPDLSPSDAGGAADPAPRETSAVQPEPARVDPPSAGAPTDESSGATDGGEDAEGGEATAQQGEPDAPDASGEGRMRFDGELFGVRRLLLPRDRRVRRTQGKRGQSRSGDKRGRYVRATQGERTTDLAFDATVRAAAPHQTARRQKAGAAVPGPVLRLESQDLRQKIRQRRTGTLIVFVVDASASMDAEQRMQATKGAVLSLLRDAYVRRDKVALVVFNGRTARMVLRPTSSVDLAEKRLHRLAVGGTTPLTHGLAAGLQIVRTERLRDPSVYPLMVLISDGRGNISLFGDEPLMEARTVADRIRSENIRSLVIDSARDFTAAAAALPRVTGIRQPTFGAATYAPNACQDLATHLGGTYFGLYDLSQGAILTTVQRSLRER